MSLLKKNFADIIKKYSHDEKKWGIQLNFPQLKIGHMAPKVPIIQGGMGVGISLSGLASAVANAGGIGIISGTGISTDEMHYNIRKAKNLVTNKQDYIGVNILFAMNDFAEKMKAALKKRLILLFLGQEFHVICMHGEKRLDIPVLSIVSSGKLARICEENLALPLLSLKDLMQVDILERTDLYLTFCQK